MKQKWKESILLFAIMLLMMGLSYAGLSGWKRTPHLYEYDKTAQAKQEKQTELARQGEERQNGKEQKQPQKKNTKNNNNTDRKEQDTDQKDDQNTSDSDRKRQGTDGDHSIRGDGENGGSDLPQQSVMPAAPVQSDAPVDGPTYTRIPEKMPTVAHTQTPEPKPTPKDEVASLACTWSDKDELLYGEKIATDGMKVVATYRSGDTKEIAEKDYTIRGLNNNSVGKHTMTIAYGNVECRLSYTINNYTKSLDYSWPTKDRCYEGEDIEDASLSVKVKMADGTTKTVTKYTVSGINSYLTNEPQNFKISYKDTVINKTFSVTGSCTFYSRKISIHCYYYSDAEMTKLVDSHSYNGDYDYFSDERISLRAFTDGDLDDDDATYKKKKYTLKEVKVEEADGSGNLVSKSLPYLVKERFFDGISLTKKYVVS